jgi:hypothetical protein
MPSALNTFKTYTANVTTTTTSIYTTPTGYTSVILLAQVSNISGNTITVAANHVRSSIPTAIITGASIPVNDAVNLLSGKLVLQTGDSISVSSSADNSAQAILSVLETLNQ